MAALSAEIAPILSWVSLYFFICDCLFITGSFVDKLAMIVYHQENSGNAVKRKSRKRDPFREQADGASLQSLLLKVASERTAERDVG